MPSLLIFFVGIALAVPARFTQNLPPQFRDKKQTQDLHRAELLARQLAAGDCASAVVTFKSSEQTTFPAEMLAAVGNCYTNLKDPARAVDLIERAITLDPNVEQYYLQLSRVFVEYNTPEPAVEIMTEARRRFPESVFSRWGLGLAYYVMKQYEQAIPLLVECMRMKSDFGGAFETLISCYDSIKNHQAALEASERFMKAAPHDFRGYLHSAEALFSLRSEQDNRVEQLIRESQGLNPDSAASYLLLGKLRQRQGRYAEAASALERAVQLREDYQEAHYRLSLACLKLNRLEESRKELEISARIDAATREAATRRLDYHRGKRPSSATRPH